MVRMAPVALALLGSGLGRRTVGLLGWFGPRGLASVVFGLIAFDALPKGAANPVLSVVGCTVLASVMAHGWSTRSLIRWAARDADRTEESAIEQSSIPAWAPRKLRGADVAPHPTD